MIDARFRPLDSWPGKLARKPAPFRRSWANCLSLLERELRYLGANMIVVEAGFRADDIRLDGWPRSGASARHPGIVLYFQSRKLGAIRMPCGTYAKWQDNLLAIGLTLERLRAIERYGATQENQQYQGFKALPAPQPTPVYDLFAAAKVLAVDSGIPEADILGGRENFDEARRKAAFAAHPDRNAGMRDKWDRLQKAIETIEEYFQGKAAHA